MLYRYFKKCVKEDYTVTKPELKPCIICYVARTLLLLSRVVFDTRVGHTCHVYF